MKLSHITFTGIDERTDVKRLKQIQKKFPFVEFGVLLSYKWHENGNRFLNPIILSILKGQGLNLSAHFCGRAAIDVAVGNMFKIKSLLGNNSRIFKRCQLNIKADRYLAELRHLKPIPYIDEVIIQMHTIELCQQFLNGQRPRFESYLIDGSCGCGIETPIQIITSSGIHIGYAGGIGPNNVAEILRNLLKYPSEEKFWIDMETSVRNCEDWFDLDKVERVLEIAKSITTEQ